MANLANHLLRQAADQPQKVALHYGDQSFTFSGLAAHVRHAAAKLAAAGIAEGDRVGLLTGATPDFIIIQQALFLLGATVAPINNQYRPNEIAHAIHSCGLHAIVADHLADTPEPSGEFRSVIITGQSSSIPNQGFLYLEDCATHRATPPEPPDLQPTTIGLMLCTSATTGKAKGVPLSIANLQSNYDQTPAWLGLNAETIILCALPLYNTFGLNQCINALMVTGGTLVLLPRFDVPACLHAIQQHRCNFFPAVPTMLQRLLDHPETPRHDISSVSRILTGGAPVPAALLERVRACMGPDTVVMTGYGLTEATALVTLEHVELDGAGQLRRPKCIGRVLPGMEMRVAADEAHIGEFLVRGPNVMSGYFRLPAESAAAVEDGWLRTGDIGYIDEDGYAYIVDRKKDVIIRGGQNIYPADIEEVLYAIPGVSEAAVIGLPDNAFGEVPVAFVSLRDGATIDPATMLAHCADRLARFKVPASIHVLAELPKGPTGKILRRALR